MNKLRAGLPALPERMQKLPIDARGYCVPWFVEWIDGKPDFRVMDSRKFLQAIRFNKCWLCGEVVGKNKTFVLGPMCTVSRTTSEPPSHYDCAHFAVRACPFMILPTAQYRKAALPEQAHEAAGIALMHNPTVMALWTCSFYKPFNVGAEIGKAGVLITVGEPTAVEWYHRGRHATREEVIAGINVGLPKLRELAESQGASSVQEFQRAYDRSLAFLPKEAKENYVLGGVE